MSATLVPVARHVQGPARDRERARPGGCVAPVGEGWAEPEDRMEHAEHKPRYFVDRLLKKVGVEALPAAPTSRWPR
jgi:hypothetical protein